MPVLICLREKLWTRTYSTRDQVPTCPVFTRTKIKPRFGIKVNSSRHTIYLTYRGLSYYYYYLCSLARTQHSAYRQTKSMTQRSIIVGIRGGVDLSLLSFVVFLFYARVSFNSLIIHFSIFFPISLWVPPGR